MAANSSTPIHDKDLQGLKYFKLLGPLLQHLHDDATARDRARNRVLYFDQYASLLLLFFGSSRFLVGNFRPGKTQNPSNSRGKPSSPLGENLS